MVVFGKKWLYSCRVVVFGKNCLYSGKSSCIRAKVVVFGQNGYYWEELVAVGQISCLRAKLFYRDKCGCIR